MSRVFVCLVALLLILPFGSQAPLIAQQAQIQGGAPGVPVPRMPPRDAQQPKTGTSRVRGRVMAADDGQPLRRAQVRLTSPELREGRVTRTDVDGRYEFRDLPAGRYTLMANKGSFVSLSYGQTRPFQPGRPLEVADNQTLDRIDFTLPRGGVITGRVVDEFGEPVADVAVMPMRSQFQQGQRRPVPAGRDSATNDIGEFRLFGLPPGQYYLSATQRMMGPMFDASDDRSGYAPTYYPGVPNLAEAQLVTVNVGETVGSLVLPLVPTRTARVTGTVLDSEGRPARGGNVMVVERMAAMMFASRGGPINPDGSFTVSNLAPGEYVLRAMIGSRPPAPGAMPEMATANVTVSGTDVSGVVLVPPRSATVAGRVVLNPAAAQPVPATAIRIMATSVTPESVMPMFSPNSTVEDDYTFELKTPPGLMVLRAFPAGPGGGAWTLKTVRHKGSDVTDTGIEFHPGENVEGIEVELTTTPPEVTGLVTDSRGGRVHDYTVVLFAQDRDRWTPSSRYIATGRPDQEGRFKVRTLPPGEYYAAAVEYVEPGQWMDPEYLDTLRSNVVGFSLGETETKTLDLKLTSAR